MQPSPEAIVAELAAFPDGMSLPRLAKRLGLRGSQVLRALAPLSEAGAGWVSVQVEAGEWHIALTEAGRARAAAC